MTTTCIPSNYHYQSPFFFSSDRGMSETAAVLHRALERFSRDGSMSFTNDDSEIFEELEDLLEECSSANWDGYGAEALSLDSYTEAIRFIMALPKTIPLPEATVEPDGEIAFEWFKGPRRIFSVSIGNRNVVTYAGLFSFNKVNGEEYFGDEIPKTIMDNLERLFSF